MGAPDTFFYPTWVLRVTRNLGPFWLLRVLVANLFFFAVLEFQHFLCYICKEYVEDLAKIPRSFLQVSFLGVSSNVPYFRATLGKSSAL